MVPGVPSVKHRETWESIRLPDGYEKPPKEEFETKLQQLIEEHKWKDFRQERNKRLAEVDWVFSTKIIRSMMTRTNNGSRTAKPYATFLHSRKIRKIPFGRNNRRCLRERPRIKIRPANYEENNIVSKVR